MIHIVFQEADIEVLQKAVELDESLQGKIEIIRDDYAVGPVENIYETEGYQQRREWWKELVEQSPYNSEQLMNMVDDRMVIHELKKALDENPSEEAWIWMGQNQHDVCGYYWLVSQLADYQGRIVVLYFNNLPFINEKGQIFYPSTLHEILPKEFLKAKKLNRKVTLSEFEVDPDEWKKLCAENAMVRILEGGKKIASMKEDFYDADIMKGLSTEWQKGNKAMHSVLSKMKIKTGDVFLLWRMRQLASEGRIEINGDMSKSWKDFEIRIPSNQNDAVKTEEIAI
jgi:hypothetical protein